MLVLSLIASFAIELVVGPVIWRLTNFAQEGRIQAKLMAIGDARQITTAERLMIDTVWIPFWVFIILFTWLQLSLMNRLGSDDEPVPPGDSDQ